MSSKLGAASQPGCAQESSQGRAVVIFGEEEMLLQHDVLTVSLSSAVLLALCSLAATAREQLSREKNRYFLVTGQSSFQSTKPADFAQFGAALNWEADAFCARFELNSSAAKQGVETLIRCSCCRGLGCPKHQRVPAPGERWGGGSNGTSLGSGREAGGKEKDDLSLSASLV